MQWQGHYEVKQNVGHCDPRIGMTGKIKTHHFNLLKKHVERTPEGSVAQANAISVVEEEAVAQFTATQFPQAIAFQRRRVTERSMKELTSDKCKNPVYGQSKTASNS